MFVNISHSEGLSPADEILFTSPFGYMFIDASHSDKCLLPESEFTVEGLKKLGKAMADEGTESNEIEGNNSSIPAIFTYLGQFIDHDVTARTDRDGSVSELANGVPPIPQHHDEILNNLKNGRRAQLDLDSVYGDGPGMAGSEMTAKAQADCLYNTLDYTMKVLHTSDRLDLDRDPTTRRANIADMRNDENLIVSQLHASFIAFHNKVGGLQTGNDKEKYIRARQLVRWVYQYIVVNEYLNAVCDKNVVADVLANGPRHHGASAGRSGMFMPLEFSVAAFRFGHSMIRPFYKLNEIMTSRTIIKLLETGKHDDLFDADGNVSPAATIDWKNFAPAGSPQNARKIDTLIAKGLFELPFEGRGEDPILANLAISNLIRGYTLRIPTGQACAATMRIIPLTPDELRDGENATIRDILHEYYFDKRTPLWYYVLRESAIQQKGEKLGEVGSRIIAETLISFVKNDPNSYLNNCCDEAVQQNGIDVKPGCGGVISSISDMLSFAEVASF